MRLAALHHPFPRLHLSEATCKYLGRWLVVACLLAFWVGTCSLVDLLR